MAVERRDPLPPGRYWTFIKTEESPRWTEWTSTHKGAVFVRTVEPMKALKKWVPAIFQTRWDLDVITDIVGEWILFDVTSPVPWVGLGFPTIVTDPNIKSTTDVITAPEPENTDLNPLGDLFDQLKTLVLLGGAIYLGGVLLTRKKR